MTTVTYEVAEHDGGWAYRVGDTWSETYPTHDAAAAAARAAAGEQRVGGKTAGIVFEDEKGQWHGEIADGGDRPDTVVKD